MGKANFEFTKQEIKGVVKKFKGGGAYVSVPSSWSDKEVIITLIEDSDNT